MLLLCKVTPVIFYGPVRKKKEAKFSFCDFTIQRRLGFSEDTDAKSGENLSESDTKYIYLYQQSQWKKLLIYGLSNLSATWPIKVSNPRLEKYNVFGQDSPSTFVYNHRTTLKTCWKLDKVSPAAFWSHFGQLCGFECMCFCTFICLWMCVWLCVFVIVSVCLCVCNCQWVSVSL